MKKDTNYVSPWKTLNSELVHESPWIAVSKHEVITPTGRNGKYSKVHFKNIAIGIIPLDYDNNTWLIGQHRYPVNCYTWEIPEGGGKLTDDPLESAKRELLEETGIVAEKIEKILEMQLSNSATDERAIIYVARQLNFHNPKPDETELLEIKKVPFSTAYDMVMKGDITDSLSVAGILKTKLLYFT